MAIATFTVIIEPDPDPEFAGYYIATVPVLPGCMVESEGVEQALADVRDAIADYVAVMRSQSQSAPDETDHRRHIHPLDPLTGERLTLTAVVDDEDVPEHVAAHAPLVGDIQVTAASEEEALSLLETEIAKWLGRVPLAERAQRLERQVTVEL